MTRRQRDDLKFALMLAFSVICMTVDIVDEPKHTEPTEEHHNGNLARIDQ